MATRAIWIIGTPFSGSTMVQQLVGRFEKVFAAGELDRIRGFKMHPHLESDPKFYLDDCAYCKAHDLECPVWTYASMDLLASGGVGPSIYDVLAEATGKSVVVDSSKTPWWFLNLTWHAAFKDWVGRVLVIHSVRNPFAFAVSYAKRTALPLEQCVQAWVLINRDAVEVVQRCAGFAPVLTAYHNQVLENPDGMLRSLASWADLGDVTNDGPQHFLGGNVSAWSFEPREDQTNAEFDETRRYFSQVDAVGDGDGRWRSKIDLGMRWRLAGISGVREMCGAFGIDIDGLIAS